MSNNKDLYQAYYKLRIFKNKSQQNAYVNEKDPEKKREIPMFSTDDPKQARLIRSSLVSISVKEAIFQVPTLTLSFSDNHGAFSVLMQSLVLIDLEWGLINKPYPYAKKDKDDLSSDDYFRQCIFYVQQRQCTISDGRAIITIQCRSGRASSGNKFTKTFKNGKLKDVLTRIATDYLQADKVDIDFKKPDPEKYFDSSGKSKFYKPLTITNKSPIEVIETYCNENNLRFYYNTYKKDGVPFSHVYILDDASSVTVQQTDVRGIKGDFIKFNFMTINANVISADMDMNNSVPAGSNGTLVVGPDGKMNLVVQPAEQETVIVYELNEKAVKKELKESGSNKNALAIVQDIVLKEDLTPLLLDKYFIARPQATAPEGSGYIIKIKCLPNPLYQIGDKALFCPAYQNAPKNHPVPDIFRSRENSDGKWSKVYQVTSLEHNITGSGGYTMDVEIAQFYGKKV